MMQQESFHKITQFMCNTKCKHFPLHWIGKWVFGEIDDDAVL